MNNGKALLCSMLLLIAFIGCDTDGNEKQPAVASAQKAPQKEVAKPAFNIPDLIGDDISSIKEKLGKPYEANTDTKLQKDMGMEEDYTFRKDRYELNITIDPNTKLAKDFFISDTAGPVKDCTSLINAGSLKDGASEYSFKPVELRGEKGKYTGVIITP